MELTTEFNSITAPIVPAVNENSKITFSRTTSIDSNVSNAQSTDEPFAKQRNSARSTKSALSILLAAESEKMRGPPPTVTDSARTDMDIKVSTSGSNISSSIDTANPSDVPSDSSHVLDMYGNPLRRSRSGSQGVSHSKSHSRSNSISQSSMHSLSEVSDERGVRVSSTASVGRKSPFCELAASSVQESDQSLSVSQDHYNHHSNNHQDDHENHEDHHRHPSTGESARRILASTSYDSDFSDGGLGAEFAAADSIGSDAGSPAFSASDEEEEAGVQEFDEFADFNEFYHLGGDLNRSGSSGHSHLDRVFSGSADSWDSKRAPTTDKLTVKHLVITILNNELLFQPQSPGAKHKESLAAKFLKTSRDSIIGSFNGAKNTLLHAHLGINNDSNSTMSAASDASTLSMLQQNVLNAAYSLPRTMQKKVPKSPASAPQVSAQQKLQRDVDALLRTRLCLYPAEDDGTAMDDLPEFSGTNDILQSGSSSIFLPIITCFCVFSTPRFSMLH